jgi:hypothetical protein
MRLGVSLLGFRNATWIFLTAFAFANLSGCGGSEEPQTVTPLQVKKEKAPDDPTAKMARAVPIGGATAPVNLKYDILTRPVVGTPVEIELAVLPTQHADSMSVSMTGSPGLALSMENAPAVGTVNNGHIERVRFTARADKDAVYYITVTATMYTAGSSEVRNFALPVIFAPPESSPAAGAPGSTGANALPAKS